MLSRIRAMFERKVGCAPSEAGDALPFALIALAVGTLLISPLLSKVSSSFRISIAAESSLKNHYATDAAVEMGLWKLREDADLRQQLLDNKGTVYSVDMPSMNAITPTVEVVLVTAVYTQTSGTGTDYLDWVVWANSQTASQTFDISGAGHRVVGGVHTNNALKVSGAGHSFVGPVEWVGSKQVSGAGHSFTPPLPSTASPYANFPISWDIAAFRPGGAEAVKAAGEFKYHEHFDKFQVSGAAEVVPPGLHYCHGDASISGAGVIGTNVTIVAEGVINVSGAGISFSPYIAGLTFFSNKSSSVNVISISGAGNTGGTSFAPNGKISLTGAGGQIIGAFLGNVVHVSGAGATLGLAPVVVSVPEPELLSATYDVRATGGGTEIIARIEQDQAPRSTWSIRNPNSEPLAYSWEIVGSDQSGTGLATPGNHVLTTQSLAGSEQARITWLDEAGELQMAVADITLMADDPPGAVSAPVLSAECSPDPATSRVWRIRNSNTFVLTVKWDVPGTTQSGTVLAPPGDSYLIVATAAEPNTTRISWHDQGGGYQESLKAGSATACEGEAPILALGLISGGRTDGTTPTFTIKSWSAGQGG